MEPFEVEYYVEQASRLDVRSPEAITLEARALRLSASGEATGDLLAAGIGRPGSFRGELGEESAIPAVGISQEDGQRLVALLAQGPVSVHLSVEAGLRKAMSRNVVVRPPDGRCERLGGAPFDFGGGG